MPVPNEDQVTYLDQAELDTGDIAIIENVHQGYSVLSGGAVTEQASPDGTVAVASGVAKVAGASVTITAGNVSVLTGSANPDSTTASSAHATDARFSLITINSSGQLGVLHGASAGLSPNNDGSYLAEFPTFSGKTVLASVFVPPTFTTIATAQISDKRIIKTDGDFAARTITPTAISATTNNYAPTGLTTANTVRQATNNSTQRNITGLVPSGFADGKQLLFHNLGPGPIALVDESGSSTAANRFSLDGDIVLPVDRSVEIQYDTTSSRWRAVGGQTAATTNTLVIGTAAAAGTSNYFVRSDDTIAHEAAHVAHDTIWAAKGDLVAGTANDTAAVVTAGTNYDVLVADSAQTAGVKWGLGRNPLKPTGALFETYPRQTATGTNLSPVLVSQTLRLQAVALPAGLTITSISFVSGTTALGSGTVQLFGLYDSSLVKLRGTTDDTSTAWAADTVKTLNLTSTYLTTTSGLYYLAILVVATTVPTLTGITNLKTGHLGTPTLSGPSSTGVSALPDPAGAISSVSGNYPYAYVS